MLPELSSGTARVANHAAIIPTMIHVGIVILHTSLRQPNKPYQDRGVPSVQNCSPGLVLVAALFFLAVWWSAFALWWSLSLEWRVMWTRRVQPTLGGERFVNMADEIVEDLRAAMEYLGG
jgi:hypothetical protein